MTNKQNNA